jgi:serine/threonine-protein kinase RsbT
VADRTADSLRIEIAANEDVVTVRKRARDVSQQAGFSLTEVTKIVTAASELARNTLEHGGGGYAEIELVRADGKTGIRMRFADQGPGIPDIAAALRDGYSTSGGLGLGLSGSRRLMGELAIDSAVGRGTVITVSRWR